MSLDNKTMFWGLQASRVVWFRPFDEVVSTDKNGWGKWFGGGKLNMAHNCIDRHIARRLGDQTAIIFDSPVTNVVQHISYQELLTSVQELSAYMRSQGVKKGDRVVIYMPNIPQAAFSMLACARIGAVHSVVFGGFAAQELAARIKDCQPKLVLASSCGIEGTKIIDYTKLLKDALEIVKKETGSLSVEHCVILQRDQLIATLQTENGYTSWTTALNRGRDHLQTNPKSGLCEVMDSHDPLYILYTSGTTGKPKGIVRDTAGHAVALAYSMHYVYNTVDGDIFWAASDVGWVVGHSYSVYGPLLTGLTTVLYEGKPVLPNNNSIVWETIAKHKVTQYFTAPTAIRAIKRVDPTAANPHNHNLTSLKGVFLAGERADEHTITWLQNEVFGSKVPIRDHWWQTETGWAICADPTPSTHTATDAILGSTYKPCPGYDLRIFDAGNLDNEASDAHEEGRIMLKLPLPPGAMSTLYNAPDRLYDSYLTTKAGYYDTGDAGHVDKDGNVFVMARTDDVLNVAGHRLSAGALEEALCMHHDIAEAAVVGVPHALKGQIPVGLVVLNANATHRGDTESNLLQLNQELTAIVRERIGPVAAFKSMAVVQRLPKTRSGKILRGTLRQVAMLPAEAGWESVKIPATIEDVVVLYEVRQLIHAAAELASKEK